MTETQSDPHLKNWSKSVWTAGVMGGLLSLVPFVNLLNLFFLFWLVMAGGTSVYLLLKHNPSLRASEALLGGALSGLIGGLIFSMTTGFFLLRLSQERIERIFTLGRWFSPSMEQDMLYLLQSGRFKMTMVVALCVFTLASIMASTVGALLSRLIFSRKTERSDA